MSPALVARSPDLRRLRDEGYEIAVVGAHLVLSHVPYLTANRQVKLGVLVAELTLAGDTTVRPHTHVVRFAGEQPCNADGQPLTKVINSPVHEQITPDLTVTFMFSSKPDTGYADYHELMTAYIAMLATHAAAVDPDATARTYRVVTAAGTGSVFRYLDTATSRAGITAANARLATDRIAIVGLGGSGSYLLDLLTKAPIEQIHLFDGDDLLQHNAFRSPGAVTLQQLQARPKKVDHYAQMYAGLRDGIVAHPYFLDENNVGELDGMSFVFLCLDQGGPKRHLVQALERFGVGFIDVGMGLYLTDDHQVAGHLRTTTSVPAQRDHIWQQRLIPFDDAAADDYGSNIQIAELNAFNAAQAVIKWKKLRGFYNDLGGEQHSVYAIAVNSLVTQDTT
ncbi:ThiF family adenylyltransferase [Actinoplanes sp. NPDC026670]|uniref:ThiF family adenylyltransferase n=1 Tax=Actinoplanes sp. NPDC026670 TaxID=3154700 RepID=UPI0033C29A9B